MKNQSETNSICCPEFNPIPWDDKIIEWDNKRFVKESVCTFFYMPMNFGSVIRRLDEKIRNEGGKIEENMGLSDHTSRWNMDIYLAVDKEILDLENIILSGRFYCKVYEGHFKDTDKWCKDYEGIVKSKGLNVKKWYMWYTTCPKCAKKYGKNYVVIVGQVE
ncbi:MAG: hydrolase [Bacteroidales bacterium]|jgi:hypothetical protein